MYGLVAVQHSLRGLCCTAAGGGWGPTASSFSKSDVLQGSHFPAPAARLPTGEVSETGKAAMLEAAACVKQAAAAGAGNGLLSSLESSLDLHDSDAHSLWWHSTEHASGKKAGGGEHHPAASFAALCWSRVLNSTLLANQAIATASCVKDGCDVASAGLLSGDGAAEVGAGAGAGGGSMGLESAIPVVAQCGAVLDDVTDGLKALAAHELLEGRSHTKYSLDHVTSVFPLLTTYIGPVVVLCAAVWAALLPCTYPSLWLCCCLWTEWRERGVS